MLRCSECSSDLIGSRRFKGLYHLCSEDIVIGSSKPNHNDGAHNKNIKYITFDRGIVNNNIRTCSCCNSDKSIIRDFICYEYQTLMIIIESTAKKYYDHKHGCTCDPWDDDVCHCYDPVLNHHTNIYLYRIIGHISSRKRSSLDPIGEFYHQIVFPTVYVGPFSTDYCSYSWNSSDLVHHQMSRRIESLRKIVNNIDILIVNRKTSNNYLNAIPLDIWNIVDSYYQDEIHKFTTTLNLTH